MKIRRVYIVRVLDICVLVRIKSVLLVGDEGQGWAEST